MHAYSTQTSHQFQFKVGNDSRVKQQHCSKAPGLKQLLDHGLSIHFNN